MINIINFTIWRAKLMEQPQFQPAHTKKWSDENHQTIPLPPKLESEKYQKRRLDMCDRIFESIVTDLKVLVDNFHHENMDQNEFLACLRKTFNDLILFAPDGEVRKLIARATNVIIDGVTKDMNVIDTEDEDDEDITCHC